MFDDSYTLGFQWDQAQPSLYSLMELNITATEKEIRQQFRRLALRHHPDKSRGCAQRFQEIREAFEVLSNPASRSQYDKTLVSQLDMEDYLRRWHDLVLTVQGFSLPLHRAGLHRQSHTQQQQQQPRPRRCHAQHAQAHVPQSHAAWGGMLTRA
ncbi:hypothetical protein ABPG75_013270 [Micractinium tetrahymenae]